MKINILLKYLLLTTISFTTLSALSFSVNKNYMGYNLIYAYGEIRFGDSYKLQREYKKLNRHRQTIVVLNSKGGVLSEGIKIGKFLKDNKIGSAVKKNGICASSCALAFLGGRSKSGSKLMILPRSSKLGYHSFYYGNKNYVKLDKVQKDISKVLSYANYVDSPRYIIAKMFDTSSTNIYWVNRQDRYNLSLKEGLGKLSFKNKVIQKRYSKKTQLQPIYNSTNQSATNYVQNYIRRINSLLTSNRGLHFDNSNYALNSLEYKTWLEQNLKYIYLKHINQKSYNKVETKMIYALKNGNRVCAKNRYLLTKLYNTNEWKILSKEHIACNYKSKKLLNKISRALP